MKHDEFIGRVQHYARLASRGDAERATRATLETLGERLAGGEPKDLASQLPPEKCTTRQLLKIAPRFRRGLLKPSSLLTTSNVPPFLLEHGIEVLVPPLALEPYVLKKMPFAEQTEALN